MMTLQTSIRNPATPAIGPEAEDAVEGVAHLVVPPVEIGLLLKVVVEVVLAGRLVERPPGAAEAADPVVGRVPALGAVGPHVPVPMGGGARRTGVDEPGVLVAGVVGHDVHEHPDAALPRRRDEAVEVVERAELRGDGAEVRDVVAPVRIGRDGDRREPDAVDAEPLQVVEVLDDAGDVAHAVGVAVGEGPRVDLVQDGRLPPRLVGRRHASGPTVPTTAARQGERSSIG